MTRHSRFEVVHTGPRKFHARLIAGNGEIVWVTESYSSRASAMKAIRFLREFVSALPAAPPYVLNYPVVDERPSP